MQPDPRNDRLNEVASVRARIPLHSHEPAPECVHHEDRDADALCTECGSFLCRTCADLDPDELDVCCATCTGVRRRRKRRDALVGLLKSPAFYVILTCMAAWIAYGAGVGNPTFEDLLARDAEREWFLRDAGILAVAQAERAAARGEALRTSGRHEAARPWLRLAAAALERAGRAWSADPVAGDLLVGQALMLDRAGHEKQAVALLRDLEHDDRLEPHSRLALRYHRGRLALAQGDIAAGKADLTDMLSVLSSETPAGIPAAGESADMVGKLLEVYSQDRRAARMAQRVRRLCGTALSGEDLRRGARQALLDYGVAAPQAPVRPRHPRTALQPEKAAEGEERKGTIRIRHFDEE